MKIINLKAENVKRIEAVDITPQDNLVEITGKNGAGKTSVLDSIWWALAGAATHQPEPIRKGQRKARIRLDLGEVVVTREFERKPPAPGKQDERLTTKIKVESTDGARFPTPQKILDSLLGALAFDPLSFARKSAREQYDALKVLLGLDFAEAEAANKVDYDKRTDYKRRAKEKRAEAEAIEDVPETPDEVVDVKALLIEMDEINRGNVSIKQAYEMRLVLHLKLETQRELAAEGSERARQLTDEAMRAVDEGKKATAAAAAALKQFDELPKLEEQRDVTSIREKIADSERVNRNIGAKRHKKVCESEAQDAQLSADGCTERIDVRTGSIRRDIEEAKMPVPGLSLDNGMVTLNDHPLEQASDAEQLRVSCAIAMRGDHKLKVIRVRDGSLLDEDSLDVLRKTAAEHDYQCWIEKVDTTGKIGFVIEAGQVKSVPVKGTEEETTDETPI